MTPQKTVFKSKTIIINALILFGSLVPSVGKFVSEYPTETLAALTILNLCLRLATKGKVGLFSESDAP